jgi:hypothetical protein
MTTKTISPRVCYGLLPSQLIDPTVKHLDVIIITEGESGYHLTDYTWCRKHAEQARDRKNSALGISPDEAEKMMCASMFQNRNRHTGETEPEKELRIAHAFGIKTE